MLWRNVQYRFQRFGVLIILVQWILKFRTIAVDFLRPQLLMSRAEDPAFHVLGLDHEHPEFGHHYMIDLGGTILGGQRDVFKQGVFTVGQLGKHAVDQKLSEKTLEPGAFKEKNQQQNGECIPDVCHVACEDAEKVHFYICSIINDNLFCYRFTIGCGDLL